MKCFHTVTVNEIYEFSLFYSNISLTFGGVTCAAGFLGVALGSEMSRRIRHRNGRADAWVCAFGLLSCLPFLFFGLITASKYTILCWVSYGYILCT